MNVSYKYQPYQGYGCAHPSLWYSSFGYLLRVRTCSDWRYAQRQPYHPEHQHTRWDRYVLCRKCGRTHCIACGCRYQPWKRWAKDSAGSVYEKQRLHRLFRRQVKRAIQRELAGEEVSHNFWISGDWLD